MKHGLQYFLGKNFPLAHQRPHELPICCLLHVGGRFFDITMKRRGTSSIERMRERDFRLDPFEPEAIKR